MNLETLAWFVAGWFLIALVVSIAVGGFLRENSSAADDDQADALASERREVRFLRRHKRTQARDGTAARRREPRRRVAD